MVDTGDLLHMHTNIPDGDRAALDAKISLFIKGFEKHNLAALGVGDRDLALLGVDGLKEKFKDAKFPLLCANVVDTAGKPAFTPYKMVESAGYKIGLFGLVTGGAEPKDKDKYKLESPTDTAVKVVEELKKEGAQAVVLLAHLDRRDCLAIAEKVPDVDIILGGQSMGTSRFLEPMGNAWWVDSGQKGKYVNFIVMNMPTAAKRPFVVREEAGKLKEELKSLDSRIERYVQIASKGPTPGTRTQNIDRFKNIIASLVKQREDLAKRAEKLTRPADDAPFLGLEAVGMNKALRDDTEVQGWVEAYEKEHPAKRGARGHGATRSGKAQQLRTAVPRESVRKARGLRPPPTPGTRVPPVRPATK